MKRFEVTIVAKNIVVIDAASEAEAYDKALSLGVWDTLDGADYEISTIIPDPYNEENDQ